MTPPRSFYRVPEGEWPPTRADGTAYVPADVRPLHSSGQYLYAHCADDPCLALEDLDGERIAGTWAELKDAAPDSSVDHLFNAVVEREVEDEETGETGTRTLTLARADVLDTDTVRTDWLPSHQWTGDPEPEPVG